MPIERFNSNTSATRRIEHIEQTLIATLLAHRDLEHSASAMLN